ncbi:MAG: hypothetical protein LBB36_02210 [Fibromonadaceae bacterium]|jgi:hypothetical protein|nr:hypothetical protein [Fibromonadaceae bacterium]
MRYIFLLLALVSFSFAQPLSLGKPNEEKEHSPWLNLGFGLGVLCPVSSPNYKEQNNAFVNPSILLGIQFAEMSALTFEFDMTAPHGGVGGWFGFEQQFMQRDITPFAEAQIGVRHPGGNFGPAFSLNSGIIFFRESQFRIRLKGGYEMIFNKDYDQSWNAEVGVLFATGRAGLKTIKTD